MKIDIKITDRLFGIMRSADTEKFKEKSDVVPAYATALSAGCDLRASICEPITILPSFRQLVPCGVHIALPDGYEAQVRPRSGLAAKYGISIVNAPGTIDADYRGEICVNLINLGKQAFTIYPGDRIAQLVVARYERAEWNIDENVSDEETERKQGGHGSTGIK